MANQLSEFLSHIKRNNIARSNRFRINFVMPQALITNLSQTPASDIQTWVDNGINSPQKNSNLDGVQRIISLTCLITDIPGYQEQTTSITNGNLPRKIVSGKTQDNLYTTFLVSGNYMEKKLFDAWHRIIMNEGNTSLNYYDDYISHISVDCLSVNDEVMYSYELTECYPTSVSQVKLDRTGQNQQMVIDVQWAFHKLMQTSDRDITKTASKVNPLNAITSALTGKSRLLAIPGLDSFTGTVQNAVQNIRGFRDQLTGIMDTAKDIQYQVRDFKMAAVDGIKMMNGVIKDTKAIINIPTDVKNEVVSVLTSSRNQLGYLKSDLSTISNSPPRK